MPLLQNVKQIIVLYPGETSVARINNPANYSLPRLLLELHRRGSPPVFVLNRTRASESYGNVHFWHLDNTNIARLVGRFAARRGTLIISQTEHFYRRVRFLRAAMRQAAVVIRLGGVYHGPEYLNSEAFSRDLPKHRRKFSVADMIVSTADGTPVDLYMKRIGVPPSRYRKWLNGFPSFAGGGSVVRERRVLAISRLSKEKGIDLVLEAFGLAYPRLTESHTLRILGDGPELPNLLALASELGIGSVVEFLGDSTDVGRHLQSSRLLVSGFANNPVMEAISAGTPVVTPELGETSALYGQHRNVFVVDYPAGGCGPVPQVYRRSLAERTADLIVKILNGFEAASVNGMPPSDLFGWPERLDSELALYDSLLATARDR